MSAEREEWKFPPGASPSDSGQSEQDERPGRVPMGPPPDDSPAPQAERAAEPPPRSRTPGQSGVTAGGATKPPGGQQRRYVRQRPHRGNVVLGLGLSGAAMAFLGGFMSWICCVFFFVPLASLGFSIPAWYMAHIDLAAMREGMMDPAGKDLTVFGMVCGIVGTAIIALGMLMVAGIFLIYAMIFGFSAAANLYK